MIGSRILVSFVFMTVAAMAQPGAGFGILGVAKGQTARINVFNEAPATAVRDPEVVFGCRVVLQFYGVEGQLLKELAIDNLAPGKIAFLDLTGADRPDKEVRTPIRAVARFGYSGGANPPPGMLEACRVAPSLELFDTGTGKAEIVLTEAKALPGSSIAVP